MGLERNMGHAKFIGRNRICYSLPVSNASDPIGSKTSWKSGPGATQLLADTQPGNSLRAASAEVSINLHESFAKLGPYSKDAV